MSNSSINASSSYMTLLYQGLYVARLSLDITTVPQIFFGIISVACALFTILTISTTKSLHRRNYYFIIGVAVGDLIYSLHFIRIAVSRLVWNSQNTLSLHLVQSQMDCMIDDFPRAFAPSLCKGFFCLCAIDRFLAVYKPHWYNSSYPTWLFPFLVVLGFLYASLDITFMFLFASTETLVPACAYTIASDSDVLVAVSAKNNVTVGLAVAVYIATIFTVYIRLGSVKRNGGNIDDARKEMQTKVVWTLALMLGSFVSTTVAGMVMYKVYYLKPIDVQLRYSVVTNTLQQLNAATDLAVLLWKNKDFRSGFLKLFPFLKKFKSATQVEPFSSRQAQRVTRSTTTH